MNTQKVLLVHRYFAPDVTSYAQMLERFAARLSAQGHDVTVMCGPVSYNEAYDKDLAPVDQPDTGYAIKRLRIPVGRSRIGRLVEMALFAASVVLHSVTRRRPYDVISVTTIPPVVMGVTGMIGAARSRRTRLVYHCMDIYPELAQIMGNIGDGPMLRLGKTVDALTVRFAAVTVVLSEDMAATIARGRLKESIQVCNNFILQETCAVDDAKCEIGNVRLMFAGNLGRFQGLDHLIEAIEIVATQRDDFDVIFLGAGAKASFLESQSRELPIEVWPHRTLNEAMAAMLDVDCAIVSLAPGVIDCAYPSKVMSILECGLPIVAVVERDSSLGRLIEDCGLGHVAVPGDPQQIADALQLAIDSARTYDPSRIRELGRSLFGQEKVLDRWSRAYGLSGLS